MVFNFKTYSMAYWVWNFMGYDLGKIRFGQVCPAKTLVSCRLQSVLAGSLVHAENPCFIKEGEGSKDSKWLCRYTFSLESWCDRPALWYFVYCSGLEICLLDTNLALKKSFNTFLIQYKEPHFFFFCQSQYICYYHNNWLVTHLNDPWSMSVFNPLAETLNHSSITVRPHLHEKGLTKSNNLAFLCPFGLEAVVVSLG